GDSHRLQGGARRPSSETEAAAEATRRTDIETQRQASVEYTVPLPRAAGAVLRTGPAPRRSQRGPIMADIKRPWYYVDPKTGKRCTKNTPGAVRQRSKTYRIRYYVNGQRLTHKGFTDKRATEALAAELERRAQREAAGILDPSAEHAKRPLAEHAE